MQPTPEIATIVGERMAELLSETPPRNQRDLASLVGVPLGVMNRAINGAATPSPAALRKLAIYFGVTTDWLLGMPDAPKRRRPKKKTA